MARRFFLAAVLMSGIICAGNDAGSARYAPDSPADFWGQIGFAYQAQGFDWVADSNLDDKINNNFSLSVVLGVEKKLGNGFGFGAEIAGWSDMGFDIADNSRVESDDPTSAEISQAYLTYLSGNTAIKAGRQALSKKISPWLWSNRSGGVLDWTYDGIVIVNTDIRDNTIIAAWISRLSHNNDDGGNPDASAAAGLFMLGLINKSLADTTITLNGYYLPESRIIWNGASVPEDTWSLWASVVGKADLAGWGVQAAYVDGDVPGWDSTMGIAGRLSSRWGNFDANIVAAYINDGDYSMRAAGSGEEDGAFWTDNEMAGDTYGENQWAFLAKAAYKLSFGKVYGSLGYWIFDGNNVNDTFGARLGYKFRLAGIDSKIEYRYRDNNDRTRQRIRLEAYYRF